jgi:hypothetical protein
MVEINGNLYVVALEQPDRNGGLVSLGSAEALAVLRGS